MTLAAPPLLFLSHAGIDSDRALSLATAIEASPDARRLGLTVWLDKRNLLPGTSWQQQLEDAIENKSTAFGILLTSRGVRNWVQLEVRAGLDRVVEAQRAGLQYKFIPILADDIVNIDLLPAFARQYQGVRVGPDNSGLSELVQVLTAFEAKDAAIFFGRTKEVGDLVGQLKRTTFAMVVGDSGSGKSSLVKAGLAPAFREGAFADPLGRRPDPSQWYVVEMRPGPDPFEGLVAGVASAAKTAGVAPEIRLGLGRLVRTREAGSVRDALRESGPDKANLLLVVDQFEELWTQTADDTRRKDFLAALLAIAREGDWSRRVVGTMRRDYFNLCSDYPALSATSPTTSGSSVAARSCTSRLMRLTALFSAPARRTSAPAVKTHRTTT